MSMSEQIDGGAPAVSRREAMAVGTGLLAAPLLMSLAGAGQPGGQDQRGPRGGGTNRARRDAEQDATEAAALRDPLTKYPKPPFKQQHQEPPGLASLMEPPPDHGEKTYRGSGKMLGRKALITGGDSGIGRAAAIAFAREGADVAIGYLPVEEPDAKEVVELVRAEGRKIVTLPGDIRDEDFCSRMVSEAATKLGGLDVVVNNAAKQVYKESIEDITTEQLDATFRTNVYAMFWITKAALGHLKPGSTIICTASINSYDPSPGILDYAMTKGAVAIFVKGLAKQLISKGIRVNGVAPGPIWTPLQPSGGQSPEKLVSFGGDTPFGRPGQPAELAATYVLLASNDSSYVTGEIYGITGGHPKP
jgi:NAD(P)-dependent dehydrogenase (short-subunit alcohol dehydrogenase family)